VTMQAQLSAAFGRLVQAVNKAAAPAWIDYATNWSTPPVLVGSTPAGDVYSYTLDGVTRYRFVPAMYDPALDAFYSNFSGGVLSGMIVSRG
jgi:hypothetical protein